MGDAAVPPALLSEVDECLWNGPLRPQDVLQLGQFCWEQARSAPSSHRDDHGQRGAWIGLWAAVLLSAARWCNKGGRIGGWDPSGTAAAADSPGASRDSGPGALPGAAPADIGAVVEVSLLKAFEYLHMVWPRVAVRRGDVLTRVETAETMEGSHSTGGDRSASDMVNVFYLQQ